MNSAWPIIILGGLAAFFAIFSLIAAYVVGPKRYNKNRLESYECGVGTLPPVAHGKFPVKYQVTAMLFIIFDVEIVFLYPWALAFDQLGLFGVFEMLLFLLTLFVAYVYVLRRGGLDWD